MVKDALSEVVKVIRLEMKLIVIILKAIKNSKYGLDITQLVNKTNLKRSFVRIELAFLLGQNKIKERRVGMSKVYTVE